MAENTAGAELVERLHKLASELEPVDTHEELDPGYITAKEAAARIESLEREREIRQGAREADEALRYRLIADKEYAEAALAISAQQVESLAASLRQVEAALAARERQLSICEAVVDQHADTILKLRDELARVRDDEARECADLCHRQACDLRIHALAQRGALECRTAIERRISERAN